MSANESTPPIGEVLGELWANADTKGLALADTLKLHREAYLRGEVPAEEWEQSVAGVMARGRWMRKQLERETMGLPCEEFDLAVGIEDVRRDLIRLQSEAVHDR